MHERWTHRRWTCHHPIRCPWRRSCRSCRVGLSLGRRPYPHDRERLHVKLSEIWGLQDALASRMHLHRMWEGRGAGDAFFTLRATSHNWLTTFRFYPRTSLLSAKNYPFFPRCPRITHFFHGLQLQQIWADEYQPKYHFPPFGSNRQNTLHEKNVIGPHKVARSCLSTD